MQKHIKTICVVCFVLLMCMSFVLAACDTTPEVEITKITLDKEALTLKIGEEATLTATVEPAEAAKDIVWTVNKEGIVTVDGGKVKAVAAGTAIVSAQNKSGTVYASCTIVVEEVVNSVKLNKNTLELTVGETETLTVTVDPTTAADKLVWKCDPVGVVQLVDGKVTALAAGTATITVSDPTGAKSDSCVVTVLQIATEITLNKQSAELYVGEEETLVATIIPQGTKAATFASSDETIATVDNNGKVVAIKAGSATITATVDKITAQCTVTVYNKATAIALDIQSIDMYSGETHTLVVTATPSEGIRKASFATLDEKVATVDENGVITAVGAGSTTITATLDDVTASVTVTVIKVAFEQQNYSLVLNAEQQLVLTFDPTSATETNVNYVSSNGNAVSVDGEGKVKAKAYGQATITASVEGKFSVTCTVTVSPLATNNGVNVTYKDDGSYNMIQLLAGINVNALNTGAQASKVYYVEYKLNGLEMHNGQVKSFGMAHFATSESYMYDAFHMFLLGEDVTTGGYWHRMNVGADLDNNLLLNQANDELGMARDYIVSALQNGKSFTFGIARNGNYVYTLINGVVVLQTNIADGLKDVDTVPALFMNVMDGENRTISDITFFEGKEATDKINGATRMLRYSRVADGNYKPVTIAADSSSLRFSGVDSADSAWRASVTQEVLFGANTTIDMDIVVHNTANGHIGINIAKNDGNGWTSKNNFSDGLTLVGYWMWTNEGKQQGVDYIHDMPTAWGTEWCGGPADENKSGSFHINITLQRSEDGTVKSVLTLTNGATVMQTVERTLTNQYSADEQYRIHFLSHAIDYEVTNLTIAENN